MKNIKLNSWDENTNMNFTQTSITENLSDHDRMNSKKQTYASVNADSCQAWDDNFRSSSSEKTHVELNKTESKKCVCTWNRTCKCCKLIEKQRKQEIKQQNIKETNKIYEQQQEQLYKRAIHLLNYGNQEKNKKIITAFRETEKLVEQTAQKYATRYCQSKNIEDNQSYFYLYKMLLLPEGALKLFVQAEDSNILRQEYKLYARNIHPDKNDHPQAARAFQKLNKYWNEIPNQLQS